MALGVGLSSKAGAADLHDTVALVLAEAGWEWEDVSAIGTVARLRADPRLAGLGRPVAGFGDSELAAVEVPTPAGPVLSGQGKPAVAEAAALLAAGPGSRIVVPKRAGRYVTVAAATTGTGP